MVLAVRGLVKADGGRLRGCDTPQFHQLRDEIPEILRLALDPLMDCIETLTQRIKQHDRLVHDMSTQVFGKECGLLQQVNGVGEITALTFVLTIEDPHRFRRSRQVGSYIGLCPRLDQSGESNPQCRISKAGDRQLRSLLVQCAQYILGHFGKECDLRKWGLKLAERGGKAGKKRAVVAVARKLAVLLHSLWVNERVYEPFRTADA